MAKKKSSKPKASEKEINRKSLPAELEVRLRAIWSKVGHLVEWCPDSAAWITMFYAEASPYRETFYWESVAQMVSDYLSAHPAAPAEEVLTDCLIATQASPAADDSERMAYFAKAWQSIRDRSRQQIEQLKKADLDLATQEGTYDAVAALYAADGTKKGDTDCG
jgi:hypothetical protein